jgi:hypothetical protein
MTEGASMVRVHDVRPAVQAAHLVGAAVRDAVKDAAGDGA